MNNKLRQRSAPWKHVVLVVAILSTSTLLSTWIGWHKSMDIKGMWPFTLTAEFAINCLYAAAFVATTNRVPFWSTKRVTIYISLLALLLLLNAYLFYTIRIDWGAVYVGTKRLTLLQTVIRSSFTPWTLYLAFFLGAVIVSLRKKRTGDDVHEA